MLTVYIVEKSSSLNYQNFTFFENSSYTFTFEVCIVFVVVSTLYLALLKDKTTRTSFFNTNALFASCWQRSQQHMWQRNKTYIVNTRANLRMLTILISYEYAPLYNYPLVGKHTCALPDSIFPLLNDRINC